MVEVVDHELEELLEVSCNTVAGYCYLDKKRFQIDSHNAQHL